MFTSAGLCCLALALHAVANPVPLPTPPPVGDGQSTTTCTTWITSSIFGFQGNFEPSVAETVYEKTETVYTYVPCSGCELYTTTKLAPFWGGVGPEEIITGTVTATEPTKVTETVCAPEITGEHGAIPRREESDAGQAGSCFTTFTQMAEPWWAHAHFDRISTVYTSTSTTYTSVECDGCSLVVEQSKLKFGHGPVVHPYTATITATEPAVITSAVCAEPDTPTLAIRDQSSMAAPVDCTLTKMVGHVQPTRGPVKTVWTITTTVTSYVDCGTCGSLYAETLNPLNPGPVIHYSTTVTASTASKSTAYLCSPATTNLSILTPTNPIGPLGERAAHAVK